MPTSWNFNWKAYLYCYSCPMMYDPAPFLFCCITVWKISATQVLQMRQMGMEECKYMQLYSLHVEMQDSGHFVVD